MIPSFLNKGKKDYCPCCKHYNDYHGKDCLYYQFERIIPWMKEVEQRLERLEKENNQLKMLYTITYLSIGFFLACALVYGVWITWPIFVIFLIISGIVELL